MKSVRSYESKIEKIIWLKHIYILQIISSGDGFPSKYESKLDLAIQRRNCSCYGYTWASD